MTQDERVRVVVFRLGEQEYVVDLAQVLELIRQPEELLHLDAAPTWVAGLVERRGQLVPVIDLRRKLRLAPAQPAPENCIIILRLPVGQVGLLADSASELLWAEPHAYEPASPVVAGVGDEYIKGLARVGDQLRVMLDLERLFTPDGWREVSETAATAADSPAQVREVGPTGARRTDQRALVVFELGGALYGVSVTEVSEVRDPPPSVPLPYVPRHVRGLINLHGTVMPVIDLRPQLGGGSPDDPPMDSPGQLIVLRGPGYPAALWADVVHGLWRLPSAGFQPAPLNLGSGERAYCDAVTRVGGSPGRPLVVLNVGRLLARTSPVERKQSREEDPCSGGGRFGLFAPDAAPAAGERPGDRGRRDGSDWR
jgi:purine-binding chemotaxis protein CheW